MRSFLLAVALAGAARAMLQHALRVADQVAIDTDITNQRDVIETLSQVFYNIYQLQNMTTQNNVITKHLSQKSNVYSFALRHKLDTAIDLMNQMEWSKKQMMENIAMQTELEWDTWKRFALWCVSQEYNGLPGLAARLHISVVPTSDSSEDSGESLLSLLANNLKTSDMCELETSHNQVIYYFMNKIIFTELYAFVMMHYSWMLLKVHKEGTYQREISLAKEKFDLRMVEIAEVAKEALGLASRDLYRCDPTDISHTEGVTYEQVTKLLQGYIENEVDLNPDESCSSNCPAYTSTTRYGCYSDLYCSKQQPCNGRILNCNFHENYMTVCPAKRFTSRRYEWINFYGGNGFGKEKPTCELGTNEAYAWSRWVFWDCSYCVCLCDDNTNSDRYFSLEDVKSDVENNMVVTGVRLKKNDKIFQLQIKEGYAKPYGVVEDEDWKPVPEFDWNNMVHHELKYEEREVNLHFVPTYTDHVVTGIRFNVAYGGALILEVQSTPYNFSTGHLAPNMSEWVNSFKIAGNYRRRRLSLDNPDVPTLSSPLPVDSEHDQFVEFTHTDFRADAAQTTVPFLDIQPVEPGEGFSLLSGVGLVHRGKYGSGGFIGLKVQTYNYGNYIQADLPTMDAMEPDQ